jgi:hypothetical protein
VLRSVRWRSFEGLWRVGGSDDGMTWRERPADLFSRHSQLIKILSYRMRDLVEIRIRKRGEAWKVRERRVHAARSLWCET